ncbi:MAG: terpene cyclase/mutase family protein [Chloroflexi bacterium]|nr:terpene cyclase/mutase family protein [Chloroflexota bacterium]
MRKKQLYLLAALALIIALLCISACSPRVPKTQPSRGQQAAEKALTWLRTQLQEDGSFNIGFGHPAGVTCDAVLAIVASGGDPATWRSAAGKPSLMDYLAANGNEYAMDAATTGKLIVTVVAAGLDPKNFGGINYVDRLQSFASSKGIYDPGSVGQAWAILALKAAGQEVPAEALTVLKSYQLENGAWASAFGPDNDTVSCVLQALVAGGEPTNSPAIRKALAFFLEQQNDDGGFPAIKPSEWGTDTNANSTAAVIMALYAVGEKPEDAKWSKAGGNPVTALLALQAEDGKIEFQRGVGSPVMATVQAIPALLGKTLPLRSLR